MSDHDKIYSSKLQDKIERNTLLMFVFTAIAVAIGGIVEIVPLFYLPNTAMAGGDGTYNNTSHKDLQGNPVMVETHGRHDPCVGIRATPIGEAMLALVLIDAALRHRAQCGDVVCAMPKIPGRIGGG